MLTLVWLIQNYGYAIVFLFTLLEGETVVALAGFVAYQGFLSLGYVIAIAIVGAIVGDQSFFYFGRWKGKQFIASRPKYTERVRRIHRLLERHQTWIIPASRFMYGFRMIIPIALGTSNVKRSKFFLLDVIGAIIWGTFFATGGYLFGNAMERFLGRMHHAGRFIIVGVLIGACIVQAIVFLRRRLAEKLEEQEKLLEKVDNGSVK